MKGSGEKESTTITTPTHIKERSIIFHDNSQMQPPPPPPPSRWNQPPHQQNQRQSRQGGQNKHQPQPNNYEGNYYEQFPSPPRVTGGRRSSSQPQQGQQAFLGQQNATNPSGEYSRMNTSPTISAPTISRLIGAAGGGNGIGSRIFPLLPPPGLGQGTTGRGSSMLLVEDPPTVNSTFPRGVEGAASWRGGGGAFGAPRAASGASSLHGGGPYCGPTPPIPGSSFPRPSYHQQDQQSYEYSVGNAFNTPHYASQSTAETSYHLYFGQEYVPDTESPRSALPPSFTPAPETARILRQQSAGSNVVEVQEVSTSYDHSSYDFGEEYMPPFSCVHSYNQHSGQYMSYPSSPSRMSPSRMSPSRMSPSRSSNPSSPIRDGRGSSSRGRGGGGRGGGGRGSRPSSSSSRGSYNDDDWPTGRNSATLRAELEAWDQSLGQPDSVVSRRNNTTGSQSRRSRSRSVGSNRSNGSSGRRRANSRNSSASGASPNPQNVRGDEFRSSKVKTELCSNYMRGAICQFGDGCNFAHGEEDLKIQTLLELDNGGITDVEIYRTRVCFTWVATGSCPFQQRCGGLHDPRVIGPGEHWLPHAEMDHNIVLAGRNVDKCHHQRLASIYNCSPIYGYVPPTRWKGDRMETLVAWKHFYSYICNISPRPTADSQELTELARVFMAIKMREDRVGQMYSYLPTHCLNDSPSELCMELERKTFAMPRCAAITSTDILDITGDETIFDDPRMREKYHIHSAHLVAFGPIGDPESRNLSVFYNLNIRECTKQESKRYKRSRHLIKPRGDRDGGRTPQIEEISTASHRQQQSLLSLRLEINNNRRDGGDQSHFYNYQPVDNDTYDLITDILKHRVRHLDSVVVLPQDSRSTTRKQLRIQQEEEQLKSRFESLRRHWMTWSWPVRSGIDKIDQNTPIPDIDGEYYFGLEDPTNFQTERFFGVDKDPMKPDVVSNPMTKAAVALLWESFLLNCQIIRGANPNLGLQALNSESTENNPSREALASVNTLYTNLCRLPVFRLLSLEVGISDCNEIMELPLLSRECTPSPEVLELLSPRRILLPQSIPNMMKTFFMEWDDLIVDAYMKSKGPFSNDGEGGEQPASVEEESRNTWMVSPLAINDDRIIAYLSSAAAKGTRSIADGAE